MKRRADFLSWMIPIGLSAVLVAAACSPARAVTRDGFSLEVLVEDTPRPEHRARGTTYIEALPRREYALRLRNHTGERIAVALSVDGLNTIDARTTNARDAAKWILGPYQTVVLKGWQTGSDTARRFYFTSERDSYGAWLGRTENLGVIAAAVFKERRPEPIPIATVPGEFPDSKRQAGEAGSPQARGEAAPSSSLSDRSAATGIGRETPHRVRRVAFDAEDTPSAVLELRYEYRDALVRLGVLPGHRPWEADPLARRERARGFPEPDFAPDPYRR